MRIGIVGLGAVGGFLGARLAASGAAEVCALARGATLAAVRARGLTLLERDADGVERTTTAAVRVADDPAALGPQDLVIVAVKTTALAEVAPRIAPMLGDRTALLSAMNGVPWWFFEGLGGRPAGLALDSVDPGGAVGAALPASRVLGAVTHLSASTPEPGVVRHGQGRRLIVGEPSGASTPRLERVVGVLRAAGFEAEASARIQRDVWFKLWGNMTMNPVSAITGATGDRLLDDPLVRGFLSQAMREAAEVGARIGLPIDIDPEERHAVTRRLGAFRTSMLQDIEAGRPVELDALVGAVREIAQALGVATPTIDGLLGLARLHARVRGLYPQG